ncbi:MAG: hypothetical protein AB1465_03745 [Patescibacteria group bacterium]
MKRITNKSFIGIIVVFVAVFFFNANITLAAGKSFNSHLKIVKRMLNKGKYNSLTNKYLEKSIKVGTYRSEYDIIPRGFAKMTLLTPNSFKVIHSAQMSKAKWNEHFSAVAAKKRGVVAAKVLVKGTKEIYVDIDGNELVYIFQVVKQKGKTKIPAILNSTLNIVKYFSLVP